MRQKLARSLAILAALASLLLVAGQETSEMALASTPQVSSAQAPATRLDTQLSQRESFTLAAAVSPKRWGAMRFAESKSGGMYLYGGNGPTRYDCSGLVMAAYAHMGLHLPRTAADQRSATATVSARNVRWGDPVFWGTGHVELFSHWVSRVGGSFVSFGAHHSGTHISFRTNSYSGVRFGHVANAG